MNQREDDEIVADVRRARERLWRESGGTLDLDGLFARLKAIEKQAARPMVSPAARRVETIGSISASPRPAST